MQSTSSSFMKKAKNQRNNAWGDIVFLVFLFQTYGYYRVHCFLYIALFIPYELIVNVWWVSLSTEQHNVVHQNRGVRVDESHAFAFG